MEHCLKILKRNGIRTLLFMMAFNLWEEKGRLCWESPAEVWNSLAWAWKQFLLRRISYMTWSIATPMPGAPLYEIAERHGLRPAEQVLANWDRNKDYLGIDLAPLGVSRFARVNLLRAGILSKACFMLASGRFDWRRNLFRIGILLRSFLDNRLPRGRKLDPTVSPVPFHAGVESCPTRGWGS